MQANNCILDHSDFDCHPITSYSEIARVYCICPPRPRQPQCLQVCHTAFYFRMGYLLDDVLVYGLWWFRYRYNNCCCRSAYQHPIHSQCTIVSDTSHFPTASFGSFCVAANKKEYGLSFAWEDLSFNDASMPPVLASLPSASVLSLLPSGLRLLYYLHLQGTDSTILNDTAVLTQDSLCPPFVGSSTTNLFKCHFWIEFHNDDHTYVWPFSPFEFTLCFGLIDQLQYWLSQHGNWFALNAGIPALTSTLIFGHILDRLLSICDSTMEISQPNQFAAPAAMIQAILGGAVAQACHPVTIGSKPMIPTMIWGTYETSLQTLPHYRMNHWQT